MKPLRDFKSVAIMGGTFNPIHNGHLAAAEEVGCMLGVERVIFVPSGSPPHKSRLDMAPAADRFAMCQAAVAGNPLFGVSRFEISRPGFSYSVDTVSAFRASMRPGAKLYFIVGADAAALMPEWKDVDTLFGQCRFVAVTRPGYTFSQPFENPSHRLMTLNIPPLDISSTEIRGRIRSGLPATYLVPDSVGRYITKKGLYASGDFIGIPAAASRLSKILKPGRFRHTLGVVAEAERLAALYGSDGYKARIAALLHDCAKAYGPEESRSVALLDADKSLGDIIERYPKVAHAFVGAICAAVDYGVADPDIINAVRYHTTGRAGMSLLEKIVYVADAIEENREPYPGLDELRRLAYEDIDKAMLAALTETSKYIDRGNLHPLTNEAINYFRSL